MGFMLGFMFRRAITRWAMPVLLAVMFVPIVQTSAVQAATAQASTIRAAANEKPVLVFAAASLGDVLQNVGDAFKAQGHAAPTFSFAASSALARQIAASGGADMFISADTAWMDYLDRKALIDEKTRRNLLSNRLVLIAPAATTTIAIKPRFPLAAALHGGRLAIAEPDSVPAGRYGKDALIHLQVWDSVKDHLAPAENVRAALAYVARGETRLGIVYETDAKAEPRVRVAGVFPNDTHAPIIYPVALIRGAKPEAHTFLTFLESAAAAALFREAGFTVLPGRSK